MEKQVLVIDFKGSFNKSRLFVTVKNGVYYLELQGEHLSNIPGLKKLHGYWSPKELSPKKFAKLIEESVKYEEVVAVKEF